MIGHYYLNIFIDKESLTLKSLALVNSIRAILPFILFYKEERKKPILRIYVTLSYRPSL